MQANVVITTQLDEKLLARIQAVSPQVNVVDASDLVRLEHSEDTAAKGKLDTLLSKAEIVFGFPQRFPSNLRVRAPDLRWIQTMSAAVDSLDQTLLNSPVLITNARGLHATAVPEFVMAYMLSFAKQIPLYVHQKNIRQWNRVIPALLRNQTVGIIGLGSIGKEIARLSKALGMRVIAMRRSTKQASRASNVDMLLPPQQLHYLLAESDFVVVSIPVTPETRNFIGERELREMKPGAYLINIARGEIVDENALIQAVEQGWITGAGVDVFTTEPLPTDSRLWDVPNIMVTPHVSGDMPDYYERVTTLFCDNLVRYLGGKRLINTISKKWGY